MYTIKDLYDLNETIAAKLFEGKTYPWEVLADIGDFIMKLGPTLPKDEFNQIEDNTNDYVIIAPVNMIYTANYKDLLDQHIESGAEISILYQNVDDAKDKYINCDVLQMNRQKGVLKIEPW